ncbi:hypothetical protein PAEPH01_1023 [Pancytospora epiphaga]|nr:hypothetical protein PAEPH01_1023 [Pancytospora epiphaga]
MSHIEELSDVALVLHNRILSAITANNLTCDATTIVKSLCEAILKLMANRQTDKIKSMLEIIIAYRENITYGELLYKVIEISLPMYSSLSLSILKSCIKNDSNTDRQKFINLLLENTAIPDCKYVLARYLGVSKTETATITPVEGVSLNVQSIQNTDEFLAILSTLPSESSETNEFIYEYLGKIESMELVELQNIGRVLLRGHKRNLDILCYIFSFYRKLVNNNNIRRHTEHVKGPCEPLLTPKIIELVRHEVVEASHPEPRIESFVALFSDLLFPSFIPMISAVNELFIFEGKYLGLLKNIVKYVGVEEFIEVVKPLQMEKHYKILRSVSNCDLETFISLYSQYDCEAKATSRNCLVSCLPGFCNYCTDYSENIDKTISILKGAFKTFRNVACVALEQLIHSHTLNMQSKLVLDNPIPREMSVRILEAVKNSNIINDLISVFIQTTNNECDTVMEMMVSLTGQDLSSELSQVIKNPECNSNIRLYDALRLMVFFVNRWTYDYDLISELLRLRSSPENNVQKKAYFLLNALCSSHSMPCFCDLLFNDSMVHSSSTRNRLLLLHTIVRKGCINCKCENMLEKFFSELVRHSKDGNVKSRKFTKEIITQLAGNIEFRRYLLSIIARETEDQGLIGGGISASVILLGVIGGEYRNEACEMDVTTYEFVKALLSRISQVSFNSDAFIKEIIQIYTLVFNMKSYSAFADDAIFIISKYITRYHKKFNSELRECCFAAKRKNYTLSKEMVTHLRFKNRADEPKDIQVLKTRAN